MIFLCFELVDKQKKTEATAKRIEMGERKRKTRFGLEETLPRKGASHYKKNEKHDS